MKRAILFSIVLFGCSGSDGGNDSGVNNTTDSGVAADSGVAPDSGVNQNCVATFGMTEACGGAIAGGWTYRNGCSDVDFLAEVRRACNAIQVSNQVTTTSGNVEFRGDMTFTRLVNTEVSAELVVPQICAVVVGGCAGVEGFIEQNANATATCTGAGDCDCEVSIRITTDDTGTYTTQNGVLTARVNNTDYAYWYCVEQGTLRYRGQMGIANDDDVFTFTLTQ